MTSKIEDLFGGAGVPWAELTVVAGEGHLSLVHRRLGDGLGEQ